MVVAGDDQHAAMRRRAIGIAVLQRVAGAVDAGALAVPEAEHAIDLALRMGLDLLRAEHRGRGEVFVDRGQELDASLCKELLARARAPDRRRRAASRDSRRRSRRVLRPSAMIAVALVEQDADERLRAGQQNASGCR